MADTKLSALVELAATPAVDDEVYIRDVSEAAADESKRITTANLLASKADVAHETKYVLKTVTETVNDDDTLQDDDVLLFPVLANKTYHMRCWILVLSNATADFKFQWAVPAGAGIDLVCSDQLNPGANNAIAYRAAGAPYVINGTGGYEVYFMEGLVYIVGTPGNVVLQWAQNTAHASDAQIYGRSWLSYTLLN